MEQNLLSGIWFIEIWEMLAKWSGSDSSGFKSLLWHFLIVNMGLSPLTGGVYWWEILLISSLVKTVMWLTCSGQPTIRIP